MKQKIYLMWLLVVVFQARFWAQNAMPETDIYLMNIHAGKEGFTASDAVNITNRAGYDNQPEFRADGSGILYTAIHEDGQADIYEYVIATKETVRRTRTAVSEYSPQLVPGGKGYSVVMVEKDSVQRLWEYSFNVKDTVAHVLLPKLDSIGYYCWINKNLVALFKLTEPPVLEIADVRTGHAEVMAKNVGRCIHRIPERNAISFVVKDSVLGWKIMELDLKTNAVSMIVRTLPGSEDYVWTSDGVLLMGKDNKLYRFEPIMDTEWEPIADFTALGIQDFYRLAISPDGSKLAIVAYKDKKP